MYWNGLDFADNKFPKGWIVTLDVLKSTHCYRIISNLDVE